MEEGVGSSSEGIQDLREAGAEGRNWYCPLKLKGSGFHIHNHLHSVLATWGSFLGPEMLYHQSTLEEEGGRETLHPDALHFPPS